MLISCGNVVIFDRFPQAIAHFWANIKKNLSPIDHSLGKVDTIIVINKKQQIIHDSLLLMHSLYHQHNPSFCLDKHIGIATNYRINLIGRNWLSILTDMQLLAVNHLRNLLMGEDNVLMNRYLHVKAQELLEGVTPTSTPTSLIPFNENIKKLVEVIGENQLSVTCSNSGQDLLRTNGRVTQGEVIKSTSNSRLYR